MKTHMTRFKCRITDSTIPLTIRVKPEDIKGAICRDHEKCVVARAIMRQHKSTAKWVDVGNCVVLIGTGKSTGKRYRLTGQAKSQVRFFDQNDGRFAPCTIDLDVPKRKIGTRTGETRPHKDKRRRRQQPTR